MLCACIQQYSQLFLKQRPSGPALAVHLRELTAVKRDKLQTNKDNLAGTSQPSMSALGRCPPYSGVRLERVDCIYFFKVQERVPLIVPVRPDGLLTALSLEVFSQICSLWHSCSVNKNYLVTSCLTQLTEFSKHISGMYIQYHQGSQSSSVLF